MKRGSGGSAQLRKMESSPILSQSPVPLPEQYFKWINTHEGDEVLCTIRNSVNKGAPYGRESWVDAMVKEYKLETTLRGGGRPRVSNYNT